MRHLRWIRCIDARESDRARLEGVPGSKNASTADHAALAKIGARLPT
jgi:hypothetical protein